MFPKREREFHGEGEGVVGGRDAIDACVVTAFSGLRSWDTWVLDGEIKGGRVYERWLGFLSAVVVP